MLCRAFSGVLAPLLREHFGTQPAFEPDNFCQLLTRVKPGFIRVNADEVTYPAHIILRHEIERALIEGDIEAAPRGSEETVDTKFLIMREGRLVFEGTEPEFLANPDEYVRKFARPGAS